MKPDLPEDVTKAIDAFANTVSDWENGHKTTADVAAAEAALVAAILSDRRAVAERAARYAVDCIPGDCTTDEIAAAAVSHALGEAR